MPHDMNGKALTVGDHVTIKATVKRITMTENYCNVNVEVAAPMPPEMTMTILALNAKQVEKITRQVLP